MSYETTGQIKLTQHENPQTVISLNSMADNCPIRKAWLRIFVPYFDKRVEQIQPLHMSSVVAMVSALTCHHHICRKHCNPVILLVSPLQTTIQTGPGRAPAV